jgi:hypothetical protein
LKVVKGVPDRDGCAVGDGEGMVFDLDKAAELFFGGGPAYSLYKYVLVADGVINGAASVVRRWGNGVDGMEESSNNIKKLQCGLCMKIGHEVIHVDFKKWDVTIVWDRIEFGSALLYLMRARGDTIGKVRFIAMCLNGCGNRSGLLSESPATSWLSLCLDGDGEVRRRTHLKGPGYNQLKG